MSCCGWRPRWMYSHLHYFNQHLLYTLSISKHCFRYFPFLWLYIQSDAQSLHTNQHVTCIIFVWYIAKFGRYIVPIARLIRIYKKDCLTVVAKKRRSCTVSLITIELHFILLRLDNVLIISITQSNHIDYQWYL